MGINLASVGKFHRFAMAWMTLDIESMARVRVFVGAILDEAGNHVDIYRIRQQEPAGQPLPGQWPDPDEDLFSPAFLVGSATVQPAAPRYQIGWYDPSGDGFTGKIVQFRPRFQLVPDPDFKPATELDGQSAWLEVKHCVEIFLTGDTQAEG